MPEPPPLHPDTEALRFLLGTWEGEGEGSYPTIEPFGYTETITVTHVGKPFLAYTQRTRHRQDGRPLHAEAGYWRHVGEGHVEMVMSHPTGHVEVSEGTVEGAVVTVSSVTVARTATAKEVTAVTRHIAVADDVLTYSLSMAAVGQPLQEHLRARLART